MTSITLNTDCLKVLKNLPTNCYDVGIVDVPYGIDVTKMPFVKEKKHGGKQKNGKRLTVKRPKRNFSSDWDSSPPRQDYFNELCRVTKHQIIFGVEYVNWVGLGDGRIKWDKCTAKGSSFKPYEMAYCSFIEHTHEFKLLWAGMMQAKSLKEPTKQQGNKKLNEKRIHICHKPILLYDYLLLFIRQTLGLDKFSVLDTHLGGGSNRISCSKLGLDFLGIEIDPSIYKAQEKRYNKYIPQLTLF